MPPSTCIRSIPFCRSYSRNGCSLCELNYELTDDNRCTRVEPACPTGRLINGQCYNNVAFCELYSLSSPQLCERCISNYTLFANECFFTIRNCLSQNGFICERCAYRYYASVDKRTCLSYPSFANNIDFNGNILSCMFGYTLRGNSCVLSVDRNINCLDFNSQVNRCIRCRENYYFCDDSQICLPKNPNC